MSTPPISAHRTWQEHKSSLMQKLMTPRLAIAKKGPQTRSLSSTELEAAVVCTWLTTSLLNTMDGLKQTSVYRYDVSRYGNQFMKAMESNADAIWQGMDDANKDAAAHSIMMGVELLHRLIKIVYRVNMREQADREAFAMALETTLNSFGYTLDTI